MQPVTVRVPASTSNLGPGFDCLGIALRLYNDVTLQPQPGARRLPPMARQAADHFFRHTRLKRFPFSLSIAGSVPASRGLGSSVTVRLGLIFGLNALTSHPLSTQTIFELCAELEGHPDNAAPAAFGGFNVIRGHARQRFPVSPALKFVLLIPDFEVRTADARALLPARIDRTAAVASCANAATIAAAFASGKYRHLRGAFADHLHQPFRKKLIPFFDQALAAAENAGALGAFLSGSGSTIAAVTLKNAPALAAALQAVAPTARVLTTTADNRGARLLPIRNQKSEIRNSR